MKQKRLSKGLKKWSHRRIGNIKLQVQIAKEINYRLEVARDSRPLNNGEDWLRKKLNLHCLGLASLERTTTRLRSRITYLRAGDANTSFFTSTLGIEKRRILLESCWWVTGSFLTKPETGACFRIYENLLGPPHDREVTFDLPSFHNRHHDLSHLEEDFSQEEIWAVRRISLKRRHGQQ